MISTGFAGIVDGVVVVLMGYAIADLSRQKELMGSRSLLASFNCWSRNRKSVTFFVAILTFFMIVWSRISVFLFALSGKHNYPELADMIKKILSMDNLGFLGVWMAVGFCFC
jgi:hypothetical protein